MCEPQKSLEDTAAFINTIEEKPNDDLITKEYVD